MDAIEQRRSIRAYQPKAVPHTALEDILRAGMLAPSAKNAQPWRFIVVQGKEKERLTAAMRAGIQREKETPLFPDLAFGLQSAEQSAAILEQAPVAIVVQDTLAPTGSESLSAPARALETSRLLSIGAAMENMILRATQLGLGTLWIADTAYARPEIEQWCELLGRVVSALAIGYPDESPAPRPRKRPEDVIQWRPGVPDEETRS